MFCPHFPAFHLFRLYTALLKHFLHICQIKRQRFRFFLMFFYQLIQRFMNISDGLIISVLTKRVFDQHFKRFFLRIGRHRHLRSEKLIDHSGL